MPSFNLGKTLAASLSVPLANVANAASNAVADSVGRVVSSAAQSVANYALPDGVTKAAEAANKLLKQNNIGDFSNLTSTVKLETKSGVTSISDAASGKILTQVGQEETNNEEAEFTPPTKELKVTIYQEPAGIRPVIFDVMPTISEDGSASYEAFSPIHHPGEILKYVGSSARSWQISAQVFLNFEEQIKNLTTLNIIRSWRMPFYGLGTEATDAELLGAPPPILTLSAYGNSVIGPVKCVLESYSTSWPNDVDYLQAIDELTGQSSPFPVILSININLKESWSPKEFSNFSLRGYQRGDMQSAFSAVRGPRPTIGAGTGTTGSWGGEARDASGKRYSLNEPATWGGEARDASGTRFN
jgi:hypothetical protein